MNQALIYYYFNEFGTTAYDNMENPVVLSIATFRKFDTTTPIHVIDVSDQEQEWLHFPKKLDFEVFRQPHALKHCENVVYMPEETRLNLGRLAKPLDVFELSLYCNQEMIMVCDADVLFTKDPFPLTSDFSKHFCFGNGLYYFEKSSLNTERIFEIWCGLCVAAAINPLIQRRIIQSKAYSKHDASLNEKTCWRYLQHKHTYSVEELSVYEDFSVFDLGNKTHDTEKIKCLHFPRNQFRRSLKEKAKLAIRFEEVKTQLLSVLGEEDWKLVFKDTDCSTVSMHDMYEVRPLISRTPQ